MVRSESRVRASADLLAHLAGRLTERDRYLCRLLYDHRVLTTPQVQQVAFDSLNAASHRLVTLYRLRVLDRFRPLRTTGSAPFHYVLDEMGAAVLAAERGIAPKDLAYRRDKALALAHSQRLAHIVGVNGFFTALAATARHSGDRADLAEWWSERRCAATWGHIVRPDGYGRWRDHNREVDFLLEYDRGTETLARLVDKLDGYADLQAATGITTTWVLLQLPSPAREAALRELVSATPLRVATSHAAPGRTGADAVWLPANRRSATRVLLAALNASGMAKALP